MSGHWKLGAAALAAASALAWGLARRETSSRPAPPPISVAAPPPAAAPAPAVTAAKPKPPARKPSSSARIDPAKTRGAGLREKGEALGGTPP